MWGKRTKRSTDCQLQREQMMVRKAIPKPQRPDGKSPFSTLSYSGQRRRVNLYSLGRRHRNIDTDVSKLIKDLQWWFARHLEIAFCEIEP